MFYFPCYIRRISIVSFLTAKYPIDVNHSCRFARNYSKLYLIILHLLISLLYVNLFAVDDVDSLCSRHTVDAAAAEVVEETISPLLRQGKSLLFITEGVGSDARGIATFAEVQYGALEVLNTTNDTRVRHRFLTSNVAPPESNVAPSASNATKPASDAACSTSSRSPYSIFFMTCGRFLSKAPQHLPFSPQATVL